MRIVAVMLFYLVMTVGSVPAHPDVPEEPVGRTNVTLAGSEWSGPRIAGITGAAFRFWFHPDGSLEYESDTGRHKNGTWKQTGTTLTFETNQRYAWAEASIEGDRIRGTTFNKAGNQWDWVVYRK